MLTAAAAAAAVVDMNSKAAVVDDDNSNSDSDSDGKAVTATTVTVTVKAISEQSSMGTFKGLLFGGTHSWENHSNSDSNRNISTEQQGNVRGSALWRNTFLGEKIDWYASLSPSVVDGYFFLSRICSQEDQTISLPQCFTVLSLASDARRKWH